MTALPRVGDRFGRYRIDAQIGEGGMGVVYLATDTTMAREVALKVVLSGLGDSPDFQARFEREASVLARLDSPHVIEIYQYGAENGCPYIATQYIGGGDLGDLLRARGPMPPALALSVCAQIADALHDAHRVGVVHRDVKPTNVLLRDPQAPELHAFLCDFGIARSVTDGLTAPGLVAGTWRYLSPECGRGGAATPASDIYSLGCLLWATLTGHPPYRGTDVEIAVAHQGSPIPSFAGRDPLTAALNEILQRTMAKDPTGRYADAEQLRQALVGAGELPGVALRPRTTSTGAPSGTGTAPSLGSTPPGSAPPRSAPSASRPPTPGSPAASALSSGSERPSRRRTAVVALGALAVLAVAGSVTGVVLLGAHDPAPTRTDPTSGAGDPEPSGSGSPSAEPSATTSSEAAPPERVDGGGPISGDLDGDGLGDAALIFQRSRPEGDDRTAGTFTDLTELRSDATSFTIGTTVPDEAPDGVGRETLVGDFDGDDLIERLTVSSSEAQPGKLRLVAELSGGRTLDDAVERPTGTSIVGVGVADVDGDSDDDVVLRLIDASGDDPIPVRLDVIAVDDAKARAPQAFFDSPETGVDTTVADFDGDGLADIALVTTNKPVFPSPDDDPTTPSLEVRTDVSFLLNDGKGGTTAGPTTSYTSAFVPIVRAADLDGDEDAELVLVGFRSGSDVASVDLADDAATGPDVLGDLRVDTAQLIVTISDVDGNGLDDVVAAEVVDGRRTRVLTARTSTTGGVSVTRWALWERVLSAPGFIFSLDFLGRALP